MSRQQTTNNDMANMAQATVKGRAAGAGTGLPVDLTAAQIAAILAGLFVAGPASAVDGHLAVFDTTTGKLIKDGGAIPGGFGDIFGTGVVGQLAEFVTDTKHLQAAKLIGPVANILTITNAAAATLALNITAAKTLTLTAADNYTLTVPASMTPAGLAIANTFTNTNLFQPSTDSLTALVVNDKDANNVLTVDTINNRVGIGTVSPSATVHIVGNEYINTHSTTALLVEQDGVKDNVLVVNTTNGYVSAGGVSPVYTGTNFTVKSQMEIIGDTAENLFFFAGGTNGAFGTASNHPLYIRTNNLARINILADGKVGIGNTSPNVLLSVGNTQSIYGGTNLVVLTQMEIVGASAGNFFMYAGGDASAFGMGSNHDFSIRTNNTARLTILKTGLVGIGNTAPTAKLHIVGSADTQQLIVKANATQTSNLQEWQNSSSTVLLSVTGAGQLVHTKPTRLKGYTVATLPAGTQGDFAYATDLLTPTFLTLAVGGGAVVGPVFYNGTIWVSI